MRRAKTLLGDALGIAGATALSRLLGLVREVVIADHFGASALYDAYLIAFFLPHALRKLLAEGALATAFVPLYARRLAQGRAQADAFAGAVFGLALVVLPLTVLVGIALAPWLVPFLADGFGPEQRAAAVAWSRLMFPFLALVGWASLVAGVLNAHGQFFLPAFAPALFNVGVIASVLAFSQRGGEALAWGVLLGGAVQLVVQLPALRGRVCWRLRLRGAWRDPGIVDLGRMLLPALVGLAVVQVNVLVDNKLASHLPAGGISALQYAIRLFQLPLGLFAVAVSTALLPRLAARAASESSSSVAGKRLSQGRAAVVSKPLQQGVLACALILFPATVGLLLLAEPLIRLLFEHGAFTPEDTARTASALRFYALGLAPYGLTTVLTRAFYAQKDGKTPVGLSALAVTVNVALALALVGPMGVGGLALSTALAGWAQLAGAWLLLERKLQPFRGLGRPLARVTGASLIMGLAVWRSAAWGPVGPWGVLLPVGVGLSVYAFLSRKLLIRLLRAQGSA